MNFSSSFIKFNFDFGFYFFFFGMINFFSLTIGYSGYFCSSPCEEGIDFESSDITEPLGEELSEI
jgi:hypothetical protein